MDGRRGRGAARHPERGTAVVEFAILLPIYVLVCFGILYLGYTALILQEGAELSYYAALTPGDQNATAEGHFYGAGYEGEYTLTDATDEGDVFSGEDPTSGNDEFDIHDILTELSYTFWGGFSLDGGKLAWETEGGKNWRGERIDRFRMMEENDATAWMLNGYVGRTQVEVRFLYSPYFLPAVNQENLLTRDIDENKEWTELETATRGSSMIRGERERPLGEDLSGENVYELLDRFPTGGGERLPGYADFGGSNPHWLRK